MCAVRINPEIQRRATYCNVQYDANLEDDITKIFEDTRKALCSYYQPVQRYQVDDYDQSVFKTNIDMELNALLQSVCHRILSCNFFHVIIRVCELDGYGDVFFSLKLAQYFKQWFPHVKVILALENEETRRKMVLLNDTYECESCLLPFIPEEYKKSKHGLCLGAATFYSDKRTELKYEEMGLDSDYPFLNLMEYGKGLNLGFYDHCRSLGLYPNELGIFIDRDLTLKSSESTLLHIGELKDKDLRKALLCQNSLEEYVASTNLYFGYGHVLSSQKHFVRLVAHLEKQNHKNIDMVLILDEPENFAALFDDALKEELLTQDIGSIILSDQVWTLSEDSSKKSLKIVVKRYIVHSDFITCLKMSRPLVLTTGDQSLSEAIACGKYCVYECYVHKIMFSDSLQEIAQVNNLNLVSDYLCLTTTPERDFSKFGPWGAKYFWERSGAQYDEITDKYLTNPDFQAQWARFVFIIQEFSVEKRVVPLIGRILSSLACPVLAAKEEELNREALHFLKDK